jgi:hypothetical protein
MPKGSTVSGQHFCLIPVCIDNRFNYEAPPQKKCTTLVDATIATATSFRLYRLNAR